MKFHNKNNDYIQFVAIAICSVWAFWILMTCAIVVVDVFYEKTTFLDKNVRNIIGFIVAYSVLVFFIMFQPECKFCGKKIFKEKNQIQKKTWLSGWPEVVLSIIKKNRFVCMHCGKTIFLKKNRKREH